MARDDDRSVCLLVASVLPWGATASSADTPVKPAIRGIIDRKGAPPTGWEQVVNAYVVKPVDFTEFVAALKEVGLFWAVINQVPWSAPLGGH